MVNNPIVNEGSPYIVFEVTTTPKAEIGSLVLNNGTATGGTTSPTDGSVDYGSDKLQYSTDGGVTWADYSGGPIIAPTDGKVLVRTTIVNDEDYEVSENFRLTVTLNDINTGQPTGNSATGVGTILDDGRGTIWVPEDKDLPNGKLTPITPETPSGSIPGTVDPAVVKFDDDRPVSVNSPTVNEGSGWIVFEVGGITGTPITSLLLGDDGLPGAKQASAGADYGTQLQYFDTSSGQWTDWIEGTTTTTIPAGGTLLVRTTIVNDAEFEKNETFTLTAKTQGGKQSTGIGTIKDDGTGDVWTPTDPDHPDTGEVV